MSDDPAAVSATFSSSPHRLRRPIKSSPGSFLPLLTRRSAARKLGLVTKRTTSSSTGVSASCGTTNIPLQSRIDVSKRSARMTAPAARPPRVRRYIREIMAQRRCALLGETLDSEGLFDNSPKYTVTTPGTLLDGMKEDGNRYHAWVAVKKAMGNSGTTETRVQIAMDLVLVELGAYQLERYPDCHFTFVDPRLAEDEGGITDKVLSLSRKFEERGIARSSIVFSIPATLSGIRAAKAIAMIPPRANRIKTNLTLVQGLTHAAACTEAEPFSITLAVGPVLRWHEAASATPTLSLRPSSHPGMAKLYTIRYYFEKNRIPIKLLAGAFRKEKIEQFLSFSGLVLPLHLMNDLRWATMHTTDSDPEALCATSKARQIAEAAAFPSDILCEVETQTDDLPPLLPSMSSRTKTMAENNMRDELAAMKTNIVEMEQQLREEIQKWEEREKPYLWDTTQGPATVPNSPEKPWDINKDGSLTSGNSSPSTPTRTKSFRILNL